MHVRNPLQAHSGSTCRASGGNERTELNMNGVIFFKFQVPRRALSTPPFACALAACLVFLVLLLCVVDGSPRL